MGTRSTAVIGDSSPASGKLFAEAFHAEGVEVLATCQDGLALVDAVARLKPSIVTLDLVLPKLTGLQVIEAVKRKGLNPAFIVASAVSARDRVLAAKEAGASYYLLKPIDADRLTKLAAKVAAGFGSEGP